MMANASPLLDVRNLSVTVDTDEGEARILDHASLSLMPGSIHGVVGESGCGKSTLMRAILGILPKRGRATEGRILLGDRDLLNVPLAVLQNEIRGGQIGFIPQDPYQALNPVFRVGTQLLETTRSKPGPKGGQRLTSSLCLNPCSSRIPKARSIAIHISSREASARGS